MISDAAESLVRRFGWRLASLRATQERLRRSKKARSSGARLKKLRNQLARARENEEKAREQAEEALAKARAKQEKVVEAEKEVSRLIEAIKEEEKFLGVDKEGEDEKVNEKDVDDDNEVDVRKNSLTDGAPEASTNGGTGFSREAAASGPRYRSPLKSLPKLLDAAGRGIGLVRCGLSLVAPLAYQ